MNDASTALAAVPDVRARPADGEGPVLEALHDMAWRFHRLGAS